MISKICWLSALFISHVSGADDTDVPDVCNSAKDPDQSPINIVTKDLSSGDGVCSSKLLWNIDREYEDYYVEYNCYDFKAVPREGDDFLDAPENTISRILTKGTPFDDFDEYCLAQFHFHWGSGDYTGSEHALDGRRFEIEAHFVHYACGEDGFGSFAEAQAYGGQKDVEERTLLVVGLQFEKSDDDNPAFDALLSDDGLKKINEQCNEYFPISTSGNVLNNLIPRDYGGYYAYKGSLTTPPCSTDVNWVVLKQPSYISEQQLQRFRALVNTSSPTSETILRNWRDLQQNNPNPIYDCDGDEIDAEESCAEAGAKLGLNCACRRSCSGSDCEEGNALAYDELKCCGKNSVCCCGDECNKRARPEWECESDSSSSDSSDSLNEWIW